VDQEVAVIHQDPLGILISLDADRPLALFFQFLADRIANSLDLARVGSVADDEVVGEGCYSAQIENSNVLCFSRFGGADGCQPGKSIGSVGGFGVLGQVPWSPYAP
jgi:hypothetical protein